MRFQIIKMGEAASRTISVKWTIYDYGADLPLSEFEIVVKNPVWDSAEGTTEGVFLRDRTKIDENIYKYTFEREIKFSRAEGHALVKLKRKGKTYFEPQLRIVTVGPEIELPVYFHRIRGLNGPEGRGGTTKTFDDVETEFNINAEYWLKLANIKFTETANTPTLIPDGDSVFGAGRIVGREIDDPSDPDDGKIVQEIPRAPNVDGSMDVYFVRRLVMLEKRVIIDILGLGSRSFVFAYDTTWIDDDSLSEILVLGHEWGHNLSLGERYSSKYDAADFLMGQGGYSSGPRKDSCQFISREDIIEAREKALELKEQLEGE